MPGSSGITLRARTGEDKPCFAFDKASIARRKSTSCSAGTRNTISLPGTVASKQLQSDRLHPAACSELFLAASSKTCGASRLAAANPSSRRICTPPRASAAKPHQQINKPAFIVIAFNYEPSCTFLHKFTAISNMLSARHTSAQGSYCIPRTRASATLCVKHTPAQAPRLLDQTQLTPSQSVVATGFR